MAEPRLQREVEAEKAGRHADAAFTHACNKLGLSVNEAHLAPLNAIVLAQSEEAEARRRSASAVCGND